MKREVSRKLFREAQRYIPGGVNSPVRAFGAVGGEPLFIQKGQGSRLWDADGNEYLDYVGSWGPLILGHAPPPVVAAICQAAGTGTSFGAPTELEVKLARLITQTMPAVEMVRFVNSGTEAVMAALRLARAFTRRDKVVKFQGGYHGHADGLLARAGSGATTLSLPDSPGVPAAFAAETLLADYNNLDSVAPLFKTYPDAIAAVIVEPVAGNMGVVEPRPGFLAGLRQLTQDHGALLVFDEVITGFRVAWGGAQGCYGVTPDLTTLGKVIGGGLPVGAYGGRGDIMRLVAPLGPVYQAGTLSGNPLAMAAGLQTLKALQEPGVYQALEHKGTKLAQGLRHAAQKAGVPLTVNQVGSLLTPFFQEGAVTDYASALASDRARYAAFFHRMLEQGVYPPPSQFEAWFLSLAHSETDLERTLQAAERAFFAL